MSFSMKSVPVCVKLLSDFDSKMRDFGDSSDLHPRYRIGSSDYNNPPWTLRWEFSCRDFEAQLKEFKNDIVENVEKQRGFTLLKFGDGDFYFLRSIALGSASPGTRAISRPLSKQELRAYGKAIHSADKLLCELIPTNRFMFSKIFGRRKPDYPAEFVYGLIADGWFTRTFRGKIGLIGSESKLRLIKKLLRFTEYQAYLGVDDFEDYIPIPDKFAGDNADELIQSVGNLLREAKSDIFLVGVGHVKAALIPALKRFRNAVFVDVGSGIDALAGIIDTDRPYMARWRNYQLIGDNSYASLDYLHFNGGGIVMLPTHGNPATSTGKTHSPSK